MHISEKKKISLFLVVFIFFLLYAPPIVKSVNTLLIQFVFCVIMLLTKYRKDVFCFIKDKNIKKFILLFGIYFGWYVIVILINYLFYNEFFLMNVIINFYSMGLVIVASFVCILYLFIFCIHHKISFNEVIKYIIYAGIIQGIICLCAFLIPPFKKLLINILYFLTGDKLYVDPYHIKRRFYGYSNGLVDAYGFGAGIIAALPLFYSIKNSKKILLSIPLLLLISILNSRTGLVVFGIGFIIWLIYIIRCKEFKKYKKILVFSGIGIVASILLIYIIKPLVIDWIVTDFLSFFDKSKFGTANILFSERFWHFPSGIRLLIGCGYSVAGFGGVADVLGFSSDIGYINELWRTGIIGLLILSFVLIYLYHWFVKVNKSKYSYLFLFFLISLFISNVKLIAFIYNPGIVVILAFTLYELYFSKHDIDNKSFKLPEKLKDKISVIVPVYNCDKYLEQCLDSIINQTYKNLEIILVNDGSKDNSLDICKKYQKKDKRIILLDQKNQGQAIARNNALAIATGDYIGFVDSDDWIDLDTYEYLYHLIKKYKSDCSYNRIRRGNYDLQLDNYNELVYESDEILLEYLKYGMKTGEYSLCTYLFDKKILQDVKFPVGIINEDIPFIYEALANAKTMVKSDKYSYNYRMSENSTTRNAFSKKDLDLITACEHLERLSENKSDKIKKQVKIKKDRSDFSLLAKIALYGFKDKNDYSEEIDRMVKNIRKNYFELMFSNMNFTRKLELTAFVINYKFSKKCIGFLKERI